MLLQSENRRPHFIRLLEHYKYPVSLLFSKINPQDLARYIVGYGNDQLVRQLKKYRYPVSDLFPLMKKQIPNHRRRNAPFLLWGLVEPLKRLHQFPQFRDFFRQLAPVFTKEYILHLLFSENSEGIFTNLPQVLFAGKGITAAQLAKQLEKGMVII